MFEYFYHEILRNTIIGFGTLFNNISIKHVNDSDNVVSVVKVPIAYGPTQKFLARLEQVPNLNKPVQISLPRMSFEFVGLTYDPTRKTTTTQTFLSGLDADNKQIRKTYMPVPYNMHFELAIFTKLNDDMLQIIEQILPYFQPAYTLSIKLVNTISEKRDIPIVIEGITMDDQYEGSFDTRRALIYTLRFTAKTYLFGPVSDVSKDIIQKVSIGFVAGATGGGTSGRDVTYSVEPRALQSYSNNAITNLSADIDNSTKFVNVNDASGISVGSYITVDSEEMYVEAISTNSLTVTRGADGTAAAAHVSGTNVELITTTDNSLIQAGDNFGFNGGL
jgi:T4-like virus Myoviridae tail sheath stabiliser